MKIEHISLQTHHAVDRDTGSIYPETIEFFRPLIRQRKTPTPIPDTRMSLRTTIAEGLAMFDLCPHPGRGIITTNVCCFGENRETAINLARQLVQGSAWFQKVKTTALRQPKTDWFILSVPVAPFLADPITVQTAGEIELYIYWTIHLHGYGR